jgi:thioredoxin 1
LKLELASSAAHWPTALAGRATTWTRHDLERYCMTSIPVSDDSFDSDVLKAEGSVLVDFWAEWCGPCKMISPALEEIAKEMDGRVQIAKMNIDDNPVTPQKYGVRGIPTLMLFRDGQVAATKVGAVPKNQLQEWVESVL